MLKNQPDKSFQADSVAVRNFLFMNPDSPLNTEALLSGKIIGLNGINQHPNVSQVFFYKQTVFDCTNFKDIQTEVCSSFAIKREILNF